MDVKVSEPVKRFLLLAVPALLAFAAYAGTLWSPFIYDDHSVIEANRFLHSLREPFSLYLKPIWHGVHGIEDGRYYRPTMGALWWFTWKWGGGTPFYFHFVSVLLHSFTTVCVALVGSNILKSRRAAFIAAVLFAIHPVHTEPVAWIAAVGDLQVGLFVLLSLALLHNPTRVRVVFASFLFFLALTSKELALMIAAVRVLELLYDGKISSAKRTAGGVFAVLVFYAVVRWIAVSGFPHGKPLYTISRWYFFEIFSRYLGLLIYPTDLELHRGPEFVTDPILTEILLYSIPVIAFFVFFGIAWKRQWRVPLYCLSWIVLSLLPACNLIPIPLPLGERSAYLASIASCWLFGWCLARLRLRTVLFILLFVLPLYTYTLAQRLPDWADEVRLYEASLAKYPGNLELLKGHAEALLRDGRYPESEAVYARIRSAVPSDQVVNFALVRSLEGQKRYGEANGVLASLQPPSDVLAFQIARNLVRQGAYKEALQLLERIPEKPLSNYWRALAHFRLEEWEAASELAERSKRDQAVEMRAKVLLQRIRRRSVGAGQTRD